MWWAFWPALVLLATSSFGTAHEQLRTACNDFQSGATLAGPCMSEPLRLDEVRRMDQGQLTRRLSGAAIERFYWNSRSAAGALERHDFTLGIAEFDDQGNAWNGDQVAAVRQRLEEMLQGDRTALVIVFVHGWKNNCEACNGNLACVRETLALFSAAEKTLAAALKVPPREVFGLYVAWRGAAAVVEPAKEASFFGRKAAADRIGSSRGGDVTNLLAWVDAITAPNGRARRETAPTGRLRNMVAYVGHSFGADVLFGAVANALDSSIAASADGRRAEPFGDALVLVNPAFEASAYRRFAEYATRPWPEGQRPLMLTVQARNDWATHYTFPAGRLISTIAQESDGGGYRQMLDALGHHGAFYTHHLDRAPVTPADMQMLQTMAAPAMAAPPAGVGRLIEMLGEEQAGERCACDGIRASDATRALIEASVTVALEATPPGPDLQIGSPLTGLASRMEPCRRPMDPQSPSLDSPLLVIRADSAIVDGHNGITRLEFFDFLVNFILRLDQLRDPDLFAPMRAAAAAAPAPPPAAAPSPWPVCR